MSTACSRRSPAIGTTGVKAIRALGSDVAIALGATRDASEVGPLLRLLRDEHTWVRRHAVEGLGLLGDSGALDALHRRPARTVAY